MRNTAEYPVTALEALDAVRKAAPDLNTPDAPIGGIDGYALDLVHDFLKEHAVYFGMYAAIRCRHVLHPCYTEVTINTTLMPGSLTVLSRKATLTSTIYE
jgi:hypothetical protein